MNPWEIAHQARYLLLAEAWDDSPTNVVFGADGGTTDRQGGAVRVCAAEGMLEEAWKELRSPFALIDVGDTTPDNEEPGLILQTFGVILGVMLDGDRYGTRVLMGGPRASSGQGKSSGRGILEVEEKAFDAIGKLTGADGARAVLAYTGAQTTRRVTTGALVLARRYTFAALCTTNRHYDAPTNLVATGGAGQVALTWTVPPDRWDRLNVVLRRATGATPPASATAGTGVTLASALATSVTDSGLAAGTYSYALFGGYDETGSGSAERYSSQETGTTRASVSVT